ncbi:MAG: histidinol-phosphatase HisJ family protein [Bacillus sp. (in: firmicutes)]
MYLMDYHHHSRHSFDSTASLEDICQTAIQRGIKEICFTEHYSVNPLAPTFGHMVFETYISNIEKCRQRFQPQLSIKMGIELCEPHHSREEYHKILSALPIDFILGSVHNIHNDKLRKVIEEQGENANSLYFSEVYEMIQTADIDVIAHLDLIKRYSQNVYGIYDFSKHQDILTAILEKAIERQIGIEINTSGLRSSLHETLPSPQLLRLYKQLGGEILTIGSDSHSAETVGSHLHEAYILAKECGFSHIYKFEKRKPIAVEL